MLSLIDAALARSRTVLALLLLLLINGTFAYVSIPKEAEPDVNIPILYVTLSHEGISPEDAERLLLRPMEAELRNIEGVKEIRASAREGGGSVVLEFDAGFDVDTAMADVREKVDRVKSDLPEDTKDPRVNEINLSLMPILAVALSGPVPERTLIRLAQTLRDEIETLPQVLEAKISGDREAQIEIIIDPLIVESYGLDAAAILNGIRSSNKLIAAGQINSNAGRFAVKVPGLIENLPDILALPLKVNGEQVITVGDIADVRSTYKDATSYARVNGQPGIVLEISKRTGQNMIETIDAVKHLIQSAKETWPDTLEVTYLQDKSNRIRTMLIDLQNNVLSAVLLVMIVVIATLGLRSAGLVGMAVPGSFLTGILVLSILGYTVNMVVLFSLILAVGMLVDGAIVVSEYADRQMLSGVDKRIAYATAAKRMFWPITASTATTLAAFMPLLFWPGVVGEFMKYLPITLIVTLSASLLMALIFLPTLGALIGRADTQNTPTIDDGPLDKIKGITRLYLLVLRGALRNPILVLCTSVFLLFTSIFAYGTLGRGVEFFPKSEPDHALLQIHARGNLSIDEIDQLVHQVESIALQLSAERHEFDSIYATSFTKRVDGNGSMAEDVVGTVQFDFADWQHRRTSKEILEDLRQRTQILAGIMIEPVEEESGPPTGKAIQIQLSSDVPELLDPGIETVRGFLESMQGVIDIEDSRPLPGIDWQIDVDRVQAARFAADVSLVGNYVKLVTTGLKFADYRPHESDDEVDIVARYPPQYRTLSQFDQMHVPTANGMVPIRNFVARTAKPKSGVLQRVDGSRVMTIKADVAPGVLADDKVREVQKWLPHSELDPRLNISFKGENKEQDESKKFLSRAFLTALFAMAVILVTQFNNFYFAFLILSAVILSTQGVLLGLLITDKPFGIVMSGIGVIALAGIVVNNNIVLIDTFVRLRKQYDTAEEAILRTGAQRLRPVLLTTITTVLGLIPMVLGMNIDLLTREITFGAPSTQLWQQLATSIVFGLSFATVLTLVVTPAALMLRERVLARWQQRKAAYSA